MTQAPGTPLPAEDWAVRYLDEHGNLRPAPINGGIPGKRVTYEIDGFIRDWGDVVDRLGWPDGEFFTLKGGSFDQRAPLPDAASAPLHTYRLTGEVPPGWTIELGRSGPAYGCSGGAVYVVFNGADGQKMNAFELVDTGVLVDVTP